MKKFLIVALFIMLLAPFCTVQIKKELYEKRIENYLIEDKSYQKDAIQSIECKWHFAGLPSYWVNVIFSDEPNVVYIYFAHDKNHLGQFDHYTIDGTTLLTEQLKHFRSGE
ncbi:hypothetical protein AMS59_22110 [Lysinibacillus sp. FJAT-14745]|uniref:DUF3139 domain-containing protein n=1 Tax=Lysinibacillus sp. FJAT-14745 TaxID=1704289 RepID=UPI0006ABCB8E|nr:DUF3139 domain-containing protein [Lysinibacillus sp. FJAT-14745]KOP69625.1 hypothetical protein AMS59_22110 [Lysinibacillus sp. FJAT-14745]